MIMASIITIMHIMSKMRKRKLDPNIIRIDDIVRIDNPEMFIRCGYPLCLDDMYGEIEEKFGRVIEDLVHSIEFGDEFVQRDDKGRWPDGTYKKIGISNSSGRIYQELAYCRLMGKKFGGNERKIFTKNEEELKGKRAKVVDVKIVKTGNRISGSGGYDSYNGEYDYEPAYLADQKTHKILQLDIIDNSFMSGNWGMGFESNNIEAIHVTKIYDKSDVERVCGMIDILDQEREMVE